MNNPNDKRPGLKKIIATKMDLLREYVPSARLRVRTKYMNEHDLGRLSGLLDMTIANHSVRRKALRRRR